MAVVQPSQRKSQLSDTPRGLEVTIPAPRQILVVLFLPIWLVGWLFGEVSVISELASGSAKGGASAFLLIWLAGWTVGGAFAIGTTLWMYFGKERVLLTTTSLGIRREALGIGRSREYELSQIRNLRVSPESFSMFNPGNGVRVLGLGGGNIAFDHGAATIRFGAGIDEAEATQIAADLRARHSFASSST